MKMTFLRYAFLRYAFILLIVLSFVTQHASDKWTGWMGQQRNGWVADFEAPHPWPKQLHKLWERHVGIGYGTPLVLDGRVYQHAREAEAEVLYCIDLKTAKTLWRQSISTPFKIGGGGEFHGKGPKSTPFLTESRIFIFGITGVLTAFERGTGEIIWQRDCSNSFEKPHPYWGATTSPIVDDQKVIVHFGGDDRGMLLALDVKTGREIWRFGEDGASYASPFIAEISGIRQLIELNHNSLLGVEIQNGRRLWEYPFPHIEPNQNMPSPVFHRGKILLGGENRGIRSVEPQMEKGIWKVKEHWHQRQLALDMSTAIVHGNFLYGLSHYQMGQLFCLEIESGNIIWRGRGRAGEHATFLSIPNYIIALMNDGELQILSTSDHQKVASYRVSERSTWAPPVLLDQGFLIKDKTSLSFWTFEKE